MANANDSFKSGGQDLSTNSAPKNFISALLETCIERRLVPKYELVQIEGAMHDPNFKFKVSVGSLTALGSGKSHQAAKHSASEEMLKLLSQEEKRVADISFSDSGENSVGDLQKICFDKSLAQPMYEESVDVGEKTFVTICSVIKGSVRVSGKGRTKKLAKQDAASKMVKTLKRLQECDKDYHIRSQEEVALLQQRVQMKQMISLSQIHESESIGGRPAQDTLQRLSSEHGLDCSFVDLKDDSETSKFHSCVTLKSPCEIVYFGTGEDPESARNEAAANALTHLKFLTKK